MSLNPMVPMLSLLHGDGNFSWMAWEIHVSVLIGCVILVGVYLAGVGPLRRRYRLGPPVGLWRVTAYLSGVAIIFLSLNGPLHDLSDNYLLSAHMVQHLLLMMIMPPLLLIGTPAWLLRPILRRRGMMSIARVLSHPATAFAVYNTVLIGWHLPAAYNWALENHAIHIVQHLMFMVVATMMWWPVVNPVPELTRLSSPLQLLYLFAFGIPMSIVSAFVTMANDVLYPWYDLAPRLFGLTALDDQKLGGAIMWVPGMFVYWTAVTIVFLRWSSREDREEPHALALARN